MTDDLYHRAIEHKAAIGHHSGLITDPRNFSLDSAMNASIFKMTAAGFAIAIVVAVVANFAGNILVRVEPVMAADESQKEKMPMKKPVKKTPEKPQEKLMAKAEPAPEPAPAKMPVKAEGVLAMLASADAGKGEKTFRKCKSCHTTDKGGKNRVGPNLWDIVGRGIGSVSRYRFSGAMKDKGGNWTYQDLDAFLNNPKGFVKGTKMSFSGVKEAGDRAALIVYLRSLSDQPKPLP